MLTKQRCKSSTYRKYCEYNLPGQFCMKKVLPTKAPTTFSVCRENFKTKAACANAIKGGKDCFWSTKTKCIDFACSHLTKRQCVSKAFNSRCMFEGNKCQYMNCYALSQTRCKNKLYKGKCSSNGNSCYPVSPTDAPTDSPTAMFALAKKDRVRQAQGSMHMASQ